ncbi:MAG: hypothetical protein D6681_01820 [Calditrichaeota bacterium]|nr:MAG: hypothetical protein D6681_01820 [Calditrichota bacterium]
MGTVISSVAFQENSVSWVQVELEGEQRLTIQRVVESPLPFVINYDNLQKPTPPLQIAKYLNSLAAEKDLYTDHVRFLLSARFGLVKKVLADRTVPEAVYPELVEREMHSIFTDKVEHYQFYYPEYRRSSGALREILTVALRKEALAFFRQIAREAGFVVPQVSLNCFTLDELYRKFFPNLIGQTLLVNFTDQGFETTVSDETDIVECEFVPYSRTMQNIEQLEDKEVLGAFARLLEKFQNPGVTDRPRYSLSQIFVFGAYLQPHWVNELRNQSNIPLRLLKPTDTSVWQITVDDPTFSEIGEHHFVEPLSYAISES